MSAVSQPFLESLKTKRDADETSDEEDLREINLSDPLHPVLFRVIRVPLHLDSKNRYAPFLYSMIALRLAFG
jgi:hypothetical protein